MDPEKFGKVFLLILVAAITAMFVAMIRPFMMAILLAAIFAGMLHPMYGRLRGWFGGRRTLASLVTVLLLLLLITGPLAGFLGVVVAQAIKVGESIGPWVQDRIADSGNLAQQLQQLPFYDKLEPYRDQILTKLGQLVGSISGFLVGSVSAATRGTVTFLFQLFLMLYCLFFFLVDGEPLLRRILYYLPLRDADERRMLEKFTSVARATIKGTLLIGVCQGTMAGLAFWVVGIDGPIFWGTVMTVLSVIPGIGTGLVWVPAAVVLVAGGHVAKGIGLAAFCALVVGSIDNLLRPRLVGRDARMHDLMILFGTMGGILVFGVLGFIVGPIVAALFVTVWDMYGVAFRDVLPEVALVGNGAPGGGDGKDGGKGGPDADAPEAIPDPDDPSRS